MRGGAPLRVGEYYHTRARPVYAKTDPIAAMFRPPPPISGFTCVGLPVFNGINSAPVKAVSLRVMPHFFLWPRQIRHFPQCPYARGIAFTAYQNDTPPLKAGGGHVTQRASPALTLRVSPKERRPAASRRALRNSKACAPRFSSERRPRVPS